MLKALFSPQSVAVVGASANPEKLGYMVLDNIIKYGYQGQVYPINPKAKEILDRPCYGRVIDIPDPVDLAVIVVPNKYVASVMQDCGDKGVGAAIIITAGFREAGAQGRQMERQVIEIAQQNGIRVVGPNCLGVIDTNSALNASFAAGMPDQGKDLKSAMAQHRMHLWVSSYHWTSCNRKPSHSARSTIPSCFQPPHPKAFPMPGMRPAFSMARADLTSSSVSSPDTRKTWYHAP